MCLLFCDYNPILTQQVICWRSLYIDKYECNQLNLIFKTRVDVTSSVKFTTRQGTPISDGLIHPVSVLSR